ncbi:hypothetical protein EVAR_17942_1 [Eumeta japonica]|uniref:Uncharacterized protein n=1 Tax=Eumeta variegata TaxID=151549 RepID=A0A4C1UY78_EUMVA|nr:hypothetical protein EVAR_17942_1 [Eumeta japonica]
MIYPCCVRRDSSHIRQNKGWKSDFVPRRPPVLSGPSDKGTQVEMDLLEEIIRGSMPCLCDNTRRHCRQNGNALVVPLGSCWIMDNGNSFYYPLHKSTPPPSAIVRSSGILPCSRGRQRPGGFSRLTMVHGQC